MISEEIRAQIEAGEGRSTALFRSAEHHGVIAATICAFLNARGGVAFVGVDPSGEIVGVGADPETARREIETHLQDAISPTALFTVSVDTENNLPIISIEAPQGRDVPYVIDGRVFVRRGKRTAVADPETIRDIVQGRSVEADRWERRPSVALTESDLVRSELADTVSSATEAGRFTFEDGNDTRRVLSDLSLVVSNGLTNACDVLFAKRPSQRHPQTRVRFIQYESDKAGAAFIDDRWVEGPLVQVYSQVMEKVGAHVRVQSFFGPDDRGRQDRPNYSLEALREGLVNALAHRDYASFSGGATLSVYPGRIEIWNSGRLPRGISIADLKRVHPSIPPNPDITHVLYLRRLMERVGRGTQKIIAACDELGARPPLWQESPSGVTLTIYAADGDVDFALSPRQAQLMERLRPGDSIRLWDYVREQEVSERQARRDLAELEQAGFLIRSGRARATSYRRTERTV
jgi:ATP-dependent DNA helicase RecG